MKVFVLAALSGLLSATALADVPLGSRSGDPTVGERLWTQEYVRDGQARSCSLCHGHPPVSVGKHERTGKPIKPMAPSVERGRLTDAKKMKKWFRRNCRWTWGRLCSPQEQADVLAYLRSL